MDVINKTFNNTGYRNQYSSGSRNKNRPIFGIKNMDTRNRRIPIIVEPQNPELIT
jgi:hypothetical protein